MVGVVVSWVVWLGCAHMVGVIDTPLPPSPLPPHVRLGVVGAIAEGV